VHSRLHLDKRFHRWRKRAGRVEWTLGQAYDGCGDKRQPAYPE
jgi:hypothetical protein